MKVLVQLCKNAEVKVNDNLVGKIDKGYVLFVGFSRDDTIDIIDKMVQKLINLRIFEDENGKMNLSLKDVDGSILSISQFTLYAKLNGRRPSFSDALSYDNAKKYYDIFNEKLKNQIKKVQTGIFGADMKVSLINDGPTTIMMDSKECL